MAAVVVVTVGLFEMSQTDTDLRNCNHRLAECIAYNLIWSFDGVRNLAGQRCVQF